MSLKKDIGNGKRSNVESVVDNDVQSQAEVASCSFINSKRARKTMIDLTQETDDDDENCVVDLTSEDDSDWKPEEPPPRNKKPKSTAQKRKNVPEEGDEPNSKKRKTAAKAKTQKSESKPKTSKTAKKPPRGKRKQQELLSNNSIRTDNEVEGVKLENEIENGISIDGKCIIRQETHIFVDEQNRCPLTNEQVAERLWRDEDAVAEATGVPVYIANNVMKLLDQDCTVPFIARYRKQVTGNLDAEKIREIEMSYESVKAVHKKVGTILKTVAKSDVDPKVIHALKNAKTMEEVEYLYAPLKPGSKRSLAERAKSLGLEAYALDLMEGRKRLGDINFDSIIDPNVAGKANAVEIQKGIQNIIADIVAKDMEILDFIRNNPNRQLTRFICNESPSAIKKEKKAFVEGKETQNYKFENYFNFNNSVKNITCHQVLAMNRGESQKVLTIKLEVPSYFRGQIIQKCWPKFVGYKQLDHETENFFTSCIKDAYDRLLEPHICRQIRSELTKKAAKESVEVFCCNLKRLLLTPPVRGKTVLGIDPGFKHGCKLAAVSCTGDVLMTDVIYLRRSENREDMPTVKKIMNIVSTHQVSIIAIGNGTACRETEAWLSNLIKLNLFRPFDVKYCIMDESGASIYSVTKQAEAELPGMDPNLRSAVCIARRLQDPLLEYVKVEPKHLGVGMYQHDMPENMLKSALSGVVVECVSFVGVDLNVCPDLLLQKIAGLNSARAKQIIEWREKNGCFVNRQQLLQVKGLGPKSFEQCAGFVKIFPQTSVKASQTTTTTQEGTTKGKAKNKKSVGDCGPNLLDTTVIHPESYETAEKFLRELKADVNEIGQKSLVFKVQNYMRTTRTEQVAEKFGVAVEQMQLILDAFKQLMDYDMRSEFEVPLFKTGVMSLADLNVRQELTGRVANVTNFGAFVDIGVGQSGLIHISKMRNRKVQLGDRVSVRVLSVDIPKKRIGLELIAT